MKLFSKKVDVYCSKGKMMEWNTVKDHLEKAGIRIYPSKYSEEGPSVPPCCRVGNESGGLDREVYQIRVLQEDKEKAAGIIHELFPYYSPYRG